MSVDRPDRTPPNRATARTAKRKLGASRRIIGKIEELRRKILRAAVGKNDDHAAAVEPPGLLDRSPQSASGADPREDASLRRQLAGEAEGRLVVADHPLVHR